MPRPTAPCVAIFAALLVPAPLVADEGMWTFDNPPSKQLAEKHGFEPTKQWLDRVRLASVRFMDGGSGSFVSPDGLMITNHHVGIGCIQNVSTAGSDYVKNGFSAATREQEAPCPGYEVNVLAGMEDVTARVQAGVTPRMSDAQAREARKAAIATLETTARLEYLRDHAAGRVGGRARDRRGAAGGLRGRCAAARADRPVRIEAPAGVGGVEPTGRSRRRRG